MPLRCALSSTFFGFACLLAGSLGQGSAAFAAGERTPASVEKNDLVAVSGSKISVDFILADNLPLGGGSTAISYWAKNIRLSVDAAATPGCPYRFGTAQYHSVTKEGAHVDEYVVLQAVSGCVFSGTAVYASLIQAFDHGQPASDPEITRQTVTINLVRTDGSTEQLVDPVSRTETFEMNLAAAANLP